MDTSTNIPVTEISSVEMVFDILEDLEESGQLATFLETNPLIKEKLEAYKINKHFNFSLWKSLKNIKSCFNYLKISKKLELKEKWFKVIVK